MKKQNEKPEKRSAKLKGSAGRRKKYKPDPGEVETLLARLKEGGRIHWEE